MERMKLRKEKILFPKRPNPSFNFSQQEFKVGGGELLYEGNLIVHTSKLLYFDNYVLNCLSNIGMECGKVITG